MLRRPERIVADGVASLNICCRVMQAAVLMHASRLPLCWAMLANLRQGLRRTGVEVRRAAAEAVSAVPKILYFVVACIAGGSPSLCVWAPPSTLAALHAVSAAQSKRLSHVSARCAAAC